MRIIGGKYRSRVLADFAGEKVRPTSDRAKEALFNILALKMYGARVLDLFAGSGSLGLESLSRGAKEVVFNDFSKESLAIVKKNLGALKIAVNAVWQLCRDRMYTVHLRLLLPAKYPADNQTATPAMKADNLRKCREWKFCRCPI